MSVRWRQFPGCTASWRQAFGTGEMLSEVAARLGYAEYARRRRLEAVVRDGTRSGAKVTYGAAAASPLRWPGPLCSCGVVTPRRLPHRPPGRCGHMRMGPDEQWKTPS
jgi:hypothetical protein